MPHDFTKAFCPILCTHKVIRSILFSVPSSSKLGYVIDFYNNNRHPLHIILLATKEPIWYCSRIPSINRVPFDLDPPPPPSHLNFFFLYANCPDRPLSAFPSIRPKVVVTPPSPTPKSSLPAAQQKKKKRNRNVLQAVAL